MSELGVSQSRWAGLVLLLAGWPAVVFADETRARPATSGAASQAEEEFEETEAVEFEQVAGRDSPASWWDEHNPTFDRAINLHYPAVTRRMALRLIIDHRTNQPLQENAFHDFLGFDAGQLKIGLGLRFGLWDHLDVGIYRLSQGTERFDIYELDAKYHLLRQRHHWLDLGLRAGVSWFVQEDAEDAAGFFAQLLLSRRLIDRLVLGTGLLYHSDSTNSVKSTRDDSGSLALMVIADLRILRWLAWEGEVAYAVAGYRTRGKEGLTAWPTFSTSVELITHRHTFALVVSNTPYISADGVVANTPRGFDDLVIGFSITREWNF